LKSTNELWFFLPRVLSLKVFNVILESVNTRGHAWQRRT
jgi:hypothetical protein